ncbi:MULTISPECIES: hypothetical protein [unclassified Polaribacter]|uniref:hypothetical protein n=1 Tax=unclassified Polaribacter TaxID=196858 RepID=UPI0011BE9879|nr:MULTISPECIES: hypothetical protein [unclassified Polaribacter]TXD53221.1 hypothetical protein ES043_05120 [Polaribacter sp. IC063]TXD61368.1 hypothetical protein ES044_05090 [Polaribacter sp. IC066]
MPETSSYSKKIIGEWQQVQTFNILDASATPATYDWFEVADGFILQLFENSTFKYTIFKECFTGNYIYNDNLAQIEFNFDCQINFYGKSVTKITASFAEDPSDNNQLFLMHALGPEICETACNSILKRKE